MKVAVIGAGSWGTALSQVLASNGHAVKLWARKQEVADAINSEHRNPRYLTGARLSEGIVATASQADALADAEAVVVVTPSAVLRSVALDLAPHLAARVPIVLCSKGVEEDTGLIPTQVFAEVVGGPDRLAVLSGPTHAEEVIEGMPTATVIASRSSATASLFRDLFATETLRIYTSADTVGVELCAALKNVIAIAVGVGYGMGLGDNTAAMLITRGLAETSRLVVACGGEAITCMGLAGTGDMVVTCMSQHSRNRRFGEQYVARGKTLADFEAETHMVVEGAIACKTLEVLEDRHGVELPITDAVRALIWGGVSLEVAKELVFSRPLTTEFYGL